MKKLNDQKLCTNWTEANRVGDKKNLYFSIAQLLIQIVTTYQKN